MLQIENVQHSIDAAHIAKLFFIMLINVETMTCVAESMLVLFLFRITMTSVKQRRALMLMRVTRRVWFKLKSQ
jgi:hypothetical protein